MDGPTKYDPQFGYTPDGAKVHMGMGFNRRRCMQGPTIVDVIAWSSADGADPRSAMFTVLDAADVPASLLCGHCFPARTRKDYHQHRTDVAGNPTGRA